MVVEKRFPCVEIPVPLDQCLRREHQLINGRRREDGDVGILITADANGRVGSKSEHTSEAGGGMGWWEEKEVNRAYKWIGKVGQEEGNEIGRLMR